MKKLFIFLSFLFISFNILSQEKNKLIFGGNLSADFGRFNDRLEIMPTIFKQLTSNFYIGVGVTFSYYQQESTSFLYENDSVEEFKSKTKTTYLGVNLLLQYYPFKMKKEFLNNLFLTSEMEFLKGKGKYKDAFVNEQFNTNNTTFFLGLGYKHELSEKISIKTSLLFKLNNEKDSPYRNPIFRIGLEF